MESACSHCKAQNLQGSRCKWLAAEMLKQMVAEAVEHLLHVIERAWQDEQILDDWHNIIIVPLLKTGNPSDCNNCRVIRLLRKQARGLPLSYWSDAKRVWMDSSLEEQSGFNQTGDAVTPSSALDFFAKRQLTGGTSLPRNGGLLLSGQGKDVEGTFSERTPRRPGGNAGMPFSRRAKQRMYANWGVRLLQSGSRAATGS
jgi:hypothetical protein